jgi:hypothetical protein
MTATTFLTRVTIDGAVALSVLAALAAWLAGPSHGLGVLAGGVLALGNLWWIGRRTASLLAANAPGAPGPLGAVTRLAVMGAAVAVVLATGLAHPIGVVVGLTVLPFTVIARGLAAARQA